MCQAHLSSLTRFTTCCFFSIVMASIQIALSSSIYILILNLCTFFTIPGLVFLAHSQVCPLRSGRPPSLSKIRKKVDNGIEHLPSTVSRKTKKIFGKTSTKKNMRRGFKSLEDQALWLILVLPLMKH